MDRMNTHPNDLLPEYALGVLEEADTDMVAEHLAVCSICQEELRGYQKVSDQLGLAMQAAAPPEGLREKILGRVTGQRAGTTPNVRPVGWLGRLAGVTRAWAAVGALAIVLLTASNLLLWQQVRQLGAGEMRVVVLSGTGAAPEATGLLIVSRDGECGTLVVDGLPKLGEEQAYQLWLIRGDERTSGGVFSVAENGYGALKLWPEEPLSDYSAFGITIEPAEGSASPTGERVLAGEF